MWTRYELKSRGKQAFKRNYWSAVVVAFVVLMIEGIFLSKKFNSVRDYLEREPNRFPFSLLGLIVAVFIMFLGILRIFLKLFVGNVLCVGGYHFFMVNQKDTPTAFMLIQGFKGGHYANVVWVMFLRDFFTGLWMLLFVIPGVIKYYEYRMIPYILGENPHMRSEEAFLISKKMMMGQKWDTFVLDLSFIGWHILTIMTLSAVGIFYAQPYQMATLAELYAVRREKAYEEGYIR